MSAHQSSKQFALNRRHFIGSLAALGAFATFGPVNAQGKTEVRIQYDWVIDNGKLGDIVALKKGFFEEEGLAVTFNPGGPNAQSVPPVLLGQAVCGQMGSFQVLTAYSEGMPVKMFASTYQQSPYIFVSMPHAPVRHPRDFVGKTVAVTPAGRWLLELILNINHVDPSKVRVLTSGTDLNALKLGQVDVMASFITNTQAMAALGPDRIVMSVADAGVSYYTGTYFTAASDYEKRKDMLARLVRALSKGWGWAYQHRKEAVDLMCDAYPNLDRTVEHATVDIIMGLAFDKVTLEKGWGWVDSQRIQRQIDVMQTPEHPLRRVPDLAGVLTQELLITTANVRPRLG